MMVGIVPLAKHTTWIVNIGRSQHVEDINANKGCLRPALECTFVVEMLSLLKRGSAVNV